MHQQVAEAGAKVERFAWVEVFRGLAILEVVLHHGSGRFLRVLDPEGFAWLVVAVLNRLFHFAVPAFLMMSALVLTHSLLRRADYGRYAKNRMLRTVPHYLIWTGVYLLYRL